MTESEALNFLGNRLTFSNKTPLNLFLLRNCAQAALWHWAMLGSGRSPMPVLPRELKQFRCPGEMVERNLLTRRSICIFNKYVLFQPTRSIPSYSSTLQIWLTAKAEPPPHSAWTLRSCPGSKAVKQREISHGNARWKRTEPRWRRSCACLVCNGSLEVKPMLLVGKEQILEKFC